MKLRILFLMAFAMVLGSASAQKLVLEKSLGAAWGSEQVGDDNKLNGRIFRLREDVRCKDLPRVPEVENLEIIISEPISIGWLALYRVPLSADNYQFVVVLYNHDKQPVRTLDLCRITGNHYCEVQDVRWDPDKQSVLFNMACPSYASEINGQGSKLYSISMEGTINWESTWLVSNDIFILDDQYVYCSYGFTSEKDYIYLLDKNTGRIYTKLPTKKKIQYLELQKHGGRQLLYAVDYDDNLFIYRVDNDPQSPYDWQIPGGPDCLTLVYATSSDGYLNVRDNNSIKSKVIDKLTDKVNGLGGAILLRKMGDWSRIWINNQVGYVYTKYMGRQTWYTGKGPRVMFANVFSTPIYREDLLDTGTMPIFTHLNIGYLIADQFREEGDYYVLESEHENLYVKKSDVLIKNR